MKCNTCGAENRDDSKFCANCGAELQRTEEAQNTKACFNCDFENSREAKFCAGCGVDLRRHHQPQPHHHHQSQKQARKKEKRVDTRLKWHPALVVLLIIGGVVGLISIPYITGNPPGRTSRPEPLTELVSNDSAVEATVREVVSKFICSCGTCGEQPLENCTCNTAIQERQFVRNAVQSGQTSEQIIAAVNTTYGWMKPEFAAKYDSLANRSTPSGGRPAGNKNQSTKLVVPLQMQKDLLNLSPKATSSNTIATALDREAIFSSFHCPCGQCGVDELKDCSCDHPRGAKEVKGFVDQKIAEQKYTVAQLIGQVDKRYGGGKL